MIRAFPTYAELEMMNGTAIISEFGRYRYRLTRYWGPGHLLAFVMLNPSTADANLNDPTIRRCIGFARRVENADGIVVVNQYAYCATSPADLFKAADPYGGPDNDAALECVAMDAAKAGLPIVCAGRAWQAQPLFPQSVLCRSMARDWYALA